jgi:hypothetical protein
MNIRDHPLVCTHNFPIFCTPHPSCTHAYTSAHTPLAYIYAKDCQSVPVNVDNATVDAVMVIIKEYGSLYKCIKQHLTINKLFLNVL